MLKPLYLLKTTPMRLLLNHWPNLTDLVETVSSPNELNKTSINQEIRFELATPPQQPVLASFRIGTQHRLPRRNLPPEPQSRKELQRHDFKAEFIEATRKEWDDLCVMKTVQKERNQIKAITAYLGLQIQIIQSSDLRTRRFAISS